ncbi:septal ring lytic transglycosylase RlpA family protein [Moraxella pluranimalium]|uniref:RlpA-like protein double-psi beta-barrel domain-containing protein n=1 Tax=Moraxella pluranimalium TaxID=470453 RepID=A0A1T0CEY4_9GAMM|nr:septal ring lytic transglycosylase RlpA family protein [Moraxella pluranimalium]OOS20912.1 hypothetical protein B0680_10180 [Moraxella pluranimalium]
MKKFALIAITLLAFTAAEASVVTYYGGKFHGRKTASGERFDENAMTCASNTHKFGTLLQVTNTANGKSVVCRVNDRGGFSKYGIALDLSKGAFAQIAPLGQGRARVTIAPVDSADVGYAQTMLAQNQADSEKVSQALAAITPLTISHTTTITLASNTMVTE